jgi:curved DNA-binding protein CbpA
MRNVYMCSKFPDNPDATHAFQKVAVAYDVLSKPHLRRVYDARPPSAAFDVFATRPMGHAEETFRGVVLGVFNDFLDGDLEVIRTLLSMYSLFFDHSLSTIFLEPFVLLTFDIKSMTDRLLILFCVLQKRSTTSTRLSSSARRALTRCSLHSRLSARGHSVRSFHLLSGLPFPSIS